MDKVYYSGFNSPFGLVFVARTARGICLVKFSNVSERKFLSVLKERYQKNVLRDDKAFTDVKKSLVQYFKGHQVDFEFPLDLSAGTEFQKKVWLKVKDVKHGRLRTYKWVAKETGNENAYRAVGNAVGKNPVAPIIPCHRIICSDGSLGGYSSGIELKRRLLKLEGTHSSIRLFRF